MSLYQMLQRKKNEAEINILAQRTDCINATYIENSYNAITVIIITTVMLFYM